jgi:rhodanese-related sulfurtransferase
MGQVAAQLLPQIKYWMEKGQVAANKIIHAGLPEARAIVSDKAGRKVRFGFKWLIHRLKGGYLWGRRVAPQASEYEMPVESLKDYRALFGAKATPKIQIYDRGGRSAKTVEKLQQAGVKKVGLPPRGQEEWLVGEKEQKIVKSERGKTEGSIGRLKSQKYGFSHRQERNLETQTAAGQTALVSANLNTLMRDLVGQAKAAGGARG